MEVRPLVRKLSLGKVETDGVVRYEGVVAGQEVLATVTGMGITLAREGAERLAAAVPLDFVLVVGIAGATEPDARIGTLVLPEAVVDGSTGTEYCPAPIRGISPKGKLRSGDDLMTGPDVLRSLRQQGVVALDMETAAIAAVCVARGIRWSVLRAISDRATDEDLDQEVFGLLHADGTLDPPAVARYVLRHPLRLPNLVHLARGASVAARVASRAATGALMSGAI